MCLPCGMMGGFLAPGRSPFFPFLILITYAHPRPFRMSRAHVFANAHDIAISDSTFFTANTMSETAKYLPSKLAN